MVKKTFTISIERGLHLRPCHAFAEVANGYECDIKVLHHGNEFRGKTSMHLMSAWIQQGDEITVICDGAGEAEAMNALADLIKSGFHEILKGGENYG